MAGNEHEVLARIEHLLAKMARTNAQHSGEDVEADLPAATRELRERRQP